LGTRPDRKLRIGVTLHLRQGQQSMWENGIFQNCVLLVQLLNRSALVKRAVLINGGDALVPADAMMLGGTGIPLMGLAEALQSLDVVIEMSAQLPDEWVSAFRDRGGRYVWMKVGNDYVIDIERALFNKPPGALVSAKQYDAVWTLPQYERSCKDYFALNARAPVRFLPHLWTPYFFDRGISLLPQGVRYGYQPGRHHWRVCCFEPNVCMVKTSFIPMLVCEEAYRLKPAFLQYMHVLNTFHMKEDAGFVQFARTLDIVNHGVASFEARFPMYEYMAHYGDCVLSHQWENEQNYIYYEALYGGYPLVHNSAMLKEYGYYYPEFDSQAGGRALLRAFEQHDGRLAEYKAQSKRLLDQLDVANVSNVEAYSRELALLYSGSDRP
jgi:hypothetical protein